MKKIRFQAQDLRRVLPFVKVPLAIFDPWYSTLLYCTPSPTIFSTMSSWSYGLKGCIVLVATFTIKIAEIKNALKGNPAGVFIGSCFYERQI
ncbi:MAG: hypothetical protein R2759_14620 [Bacteroidales bacterium]